MSTTETGEPRYRLPRTVVPDRYELTLAPDLDAGTFTGEEKVHVRVVQAVDEVVLNAIGLDIHSASLVSSDGRRLTGEVSLDEDEEQLTVRLSDLAEPGPWTLELTFGGTLERDLLRGFYRSTFTGADGETRVIATTQFEATDARRAFPCWDEPDRKAVFSVTLVVPEGCVAVSNGPVVDETDLGDGRRQVRFGDTIRMSTYLVAFVVGPLVATDPVDVDGTPLRVVCVPGKEHLADFALEAGAHALRFFASWFGIPYPAEKMDFIALPDFAAGAMENLGCVTYREAVLLVDPATASQVELQRVADVVCHEVAHMWFGDLVTMKWWNGIWLNEAFATFMELLAVDAFRPEWQRWVTFGRSRAAALVVDGLAATRTIEYPVGRPEEADGMFDVLTYEKGASVLRMLEQYLGPEPFRAGIRRYLEANAYANAETTDLWDAIETATGEPARAAMDSWIFQPGYPVVSVGRSGTEVTLSQERFSYSGAGGAERWHVPVVLRAGPGGDRHRVLLASERGAVDAGGEPTWVVANEDGNGYYRVRYTPELLRDLAPELDRLSPLERLGLVNDTWAVTVAGQTPLADYLALAARPPEEDDPDVWWTIADSLQFVSLCASDDDRPRFLEWARGVLRPAFDRHGWRPGTGERTGVRQAVLAAALGTWAGDDEIRTQAADLHAGYLDDRSSVHPDLVPAVVSIWARAGGAEEYGTCIERWKHPATPQEETRYLYALAEMSDPGLVDRTLGLVFGEVRSQNAPFLLMYLMQNPASQEQAWQAITERWDEMKKRFPGNLTPRVMHDYLSPRMLNGIAGLDADLAEVAADFAESHPVPGHDRTIAQAAERARVHAAMRRRERAAVAAFVSRL